MTIRIYWEISAYIWITQMETPTNSMKSSHVSISSSLLIVHGHWLNLLTTKLISNSIKSVFRQQVSRTILRSYQKLTVVRRNETLCQQYDSVLRSI